MLDLHSNPNLTLTYSTPLVAPTNGQQQKSIAIVRAESELAAIDELMADLTDLRSPEVETSSSD